MIEKLQKCNLPQLEPFGKDIVPLIVKQDSTCVEELKGSGFVVKNIFSVDRGSRVLRRRSGTSNFTNCCYRPFYRINDYYNGSERCDVSYHPRLSLPCWFIFSDLSCILFYSVRVDDDCIKITSDTTELPAEHEFIEIACPGLKKFSLVIVAEKAEVEDRLKSFKEKSTLRMDRGDQLNVVVIGLDSTSRMNFIRYVTPFTYQS
jgi:hypothetical protein